MSVKLFQGDFKFEDLAIDMEFEDMYHGTRATVTRLTENSVELLIRTDRNNLDAAGKRKGVDSTCWFTMKSFNMQFKPL